MTEPHSTKVTMDVSSPATAHQSIVQPQNDDGKVRILLGVFVIAALGLFYVLQQMPQFDEESSAKLRMPSSVSDVRELSVILQKYCDHNYSAVLIGFCICYIFLQAFAIPGSLFLSFLAGALFGFPVGFPVVVMNCTIGSSICFILSNLLGRSFVLRLFPEKMDFFRTKLQQHQKHLYNYMLFLRISPLLPNWFINISSPVIGVPYDAFLFGTFFGVMPGTFLAIQTGMTINDLTSSDIDQLGIRFSVSLMIIGLISLIPSLIRKFLEGRMEDEEKSE